MFTDYLSNELSDERIEFISNIGVGSASASDLNKPLKSLRKIMEKAQLSQEFIVPSVSNAVSNAMSQLRTAFQELATTDLANTGNPAIFINQKVEAITSRANEVISILIPIAAFSTEFDATKLTNYEKLAAETLENIQTLKSQAASFAETQAVSEVWNFFTNRAEQYGKQVKRFSLSLVAALGVVLILVVIMSMKSINFSSPQETTWALFPIINILAVSWFVINLLSRNLRTNQHLQALNESKATVMQSGLVLINTSKESEDNSDIRSAVFQTCFNVNDLGYLRNEKESNSYGNAGILGLIKQISGK